MANGKLPRWYYDACALDLREVFVEMTKKNRPYDALVSFLALGEAFGNNFRKRQDLGESFIELIGKLKNYITIISNEGTNDILKELMADFPKLDAADALHLATAIHNDCEMVRTSDRDLYGIPEKKLTEFSKKQGKKDIFISPVKY